MPSNDKMISFEEHKRQIDEYQNMFSCYETYAQVLKRVLEKACKASFQDAFVQSRPKSVSSFAEKVVRKCGKYTDPVNMFTDLCGARVIVQTLEQVDAVKLFIKANFLIDEEDEKGLHLGEDKFGYRDMHYIVQLRPDRCDDFGISPEERKAIGSRKAEVQVRTWLQHAWADSLHDRVYKNTLQLSSKIKRTGNLLAALMEEGDRNFDTIVHELDGMIANYTTFAKKETVDKEIQIQEQILANELKLEKKAGMALKLGRLLAACGNYDRVAQILEPYKTINDANRCELLLELGYALCKLNRKTPASPQYREGLGYLQEALTLCQSKQLLFVPHLRKRESLYARVLARLAWVLEVIEGKKLEAKEYWHQAHEHEPANPYYLADMLGFEISLERNLKIVKMMRTTLQQAIKTCNNHAVDGIELPFAYFTAGRLSLLLGLIPDSIGYYCRGIRYCMDATHYFPADVLESEINWVRRFIDIELLPPVFQWILDLFELSATALSLDHGTTQREPRALIIAGGAMSIDADGIKLIRPLVETALASYTGLVLAGGTNIGVPGCVGDVAGELELKKKKAFSLFGYVPRKLPSDAPRHGSYEFKVCGESDFGPNQIIGYWHDLFEQKIDAREVLCLGFGGGFVSLEEYYIALALGATVAIVPLKEGDMADLLSKDQVWSGTNNLFALPIDPATVRAFIVPSVKKYEEDIQVKMAQSFHTNYVKGNTGKLPDNLKPWDKLNETYRRANIDQAQYAVQILEACGFSVRPVADPANTVIFSQFTDKEIECMAELEHGRWNAERLHDGWRTGQRDDVKKTHNCIVSWKKLSDGPDGVKKYDRESVLRFPEVLAMAGLEIYRSQQAR